MRQYLFLLFSIPLLFCGPLLFSQEAGPENADPEAMSLLEFFRSRQDSLPLLKLETDWNRLVRNKMREEYQPGVLSFLLEDGAVARLEIKLRARGNIRKEVCYYPPVKIKAKKKQLAGLGFKPVNDLKLVLPCNSGNSAEDCLLRESLAYRFYEVIHPVHIKTMVIKLESWDEGEKKQVFPALLLEDEEELAARLEAKVSNRGVTRLSTLDRDAYLKMCFFQYMIANVDWSLPNSHNLEFLYVPGYQRLVAIPYDFDYAGFIGASYAVPAPSLPIRSVYQRYFLGKNVTKEEALEYAKFFLGLKGQIMEICDKFSLMDKKDIETSQKMLSKFFDLLDNEKKVIRAFATE